MPAICWLNSKPSLKALKSRWKLRQSGDSIIRTFIYFQREFLPTSRESRNRLLTLFLIFAIGLLSGCWLHPTVPSQPSDIAFVSNRDGNLEIYTIKQDGSNSNRETGGKTQRVSAAA